MVAKRPASASSTRPTAKANAKAATRKPKRPGWCNELSEPVTEEQWCASTGAQKARWRRLRDFTEKPARPLWCEVAGISEAQWANASPNLRQLFRYRHIYSQAAVGQDADDVGAAGPMYTLPAWNALSEEERVALRELRPKVFVGQKTSCPINVRALEHYIVHFAEGRRVWEAQGLIDAVKDHPESALVIEYYRRYGMGRRLSDPWQCLATLHHHIRGVAAIPFSEDPHKIMKDVDLKNAHCFLTLFLGRQLGISELELFPLIDYIARRDEFFLPEAIKALGFRAEDPSSREVPKKLWLAILNGGTLANWGWSNDVSYSIKRMSTVLKQHLKDFSRCCKTVRDASVAREEHTSNRVGGESPRVWHYILSELEDKALHVVETGIRLLGGEVHQLIYDGLLCSGPFTEKDVNIFCTDRIEAAVGIALEVSVKPLKRPKGYDLLLSAFPIEQRPCI